MRYYRHHHSFPEVIQGSQLKDDSIKSLFQIHKTAVAIPLLHHNQLIGVVFLGERLDGAAYGRREIRALEMIATELVVAVQNALSVDEIKVLNETLQRKVDESTKELRMTNPHQQLIVLVGEILAFTREDARPRALRLVTTLRVHIDDVVDPLLAVAVLDAEIEPVQHHAHRTPAAIEVLGQHQVTGLAFLGYDAYTGLLSTQIGRASCRERV